MLNKIRILTSGKWRATIVYLLILGLSVGAVLLLVWDLASIWGKEGSNYSAVLRSAVYSLAILVAGAVAIYKLQVFRDLEPHLTISQAVSHRSVGDKYTHIFVTTTLRNSSKVEVDVRQEFFRVQQIAPVSNEELDRLVGAVFRRENQQEESQKEIQWPTLDEVWRDWDPHEVIVEPGESHQETVEFVIPSDVRPVLVYYYFFNPRFLPGSGTVEGWGATSVHDIVGTDEWDKGAGDEQ